MESQESLDLEDIQGAEASSESAMDNSRRLLHCQDDSNDSNPLDNLMYADHQYQRQQHHLLDKFLRGDREPGDSQDSEFRMLAPLVVGEDLFLEEPDNDNESEWSLDIK